MKAGRVATAGMLTALQVLTLAISYLVPTIKLALLFAAAVYPGILLRLGFSRKAVITSCTASIILAVFLIQVPIIQVGFAAFFGWYAFVHEGTKKMPLVSKQALRILFFAVSVGIVYLAATYFVSFESSYALWIMALATVFAFFAMQYLYEFVVKRIVRSGKIKLSGDKITFR